MADALKIRSYLVESLVPVGAKPGRVTKVGPAQPFRDAEQMIGRVARQCIGSLESFSHQRLAALRALRVREIRFLAFPAWIDARPGIAAGVGEGVALIAFVA